MNSPYGKVRVSGDPLDKFPALRDHLAQQYQYKGLPPLTRHSRPRPEPVVPNPAPSRDPTNQATLVPPRSLDAKRLGQLARRIWVDYFRIQYAVWSTALVASVYAYLHHGQLISSIFKTVIALFMTYELLSSAYRGERVRSAVRQMSSIWAQPTAPEPDRIRLVGQFTQENALKSNSTIVIAPSCTPSPSPSSISPLEPQVERMPARHFRNPSPSPSPSPPPMPQPTNTPSATGMGFYVYPPNRAVHGRFKAFRGFTPDPLVATSNAGMVPLARLLAPTLPELNRGVDCEW